MYGMAGGLSVLYNCALHACMFTHACLHCLHGSMVAWWRKGKKQQSAGNFLSCLKNVGIPMVHGRNFPKLFFKMSS